MELETILRQQVERATGVKQASAPVKKLKGDASNRSYYRVGEGSRSWVAMVMPQGGGVSEEATKGGAPTELPFINVHRYLDGLGVRVPRILAYDAPAGTMVLEDLGDVTFEAALEGGKNRDALYRRAVELLAKLRVRAEEKPDPACLAFSRAFDEDLYAWELHHFREYGMEAWSGRQSTRDERTVLDEEFRKLSARLASLPRGFTHRDYQSRNIMVTGGELVVIDFQDALQGPRQYDLVALLRDSYVELDRDFVDQMLDAYLDAFARAGGPRLDASDFKRQFDWLTVQRKMKDAGRFEYIHRVKGNSGFLVSIPASLRYVKAALDRLPELDPMRRIVTRYVPALA